MDDFVHNKLTEWGLSEYIQKFKGKVFQWLFVEGFRQTRCRNHETMNAGQPDGGQVEVVSVSI